MWRNPFAAGVADPQPGSKRRAWRRYHRAGNPLDRSITPEDEHALQVAVARYFPDADGPISSMQACMFTNSPDEHFVVDALPDHPQVHVAAGFSGHGYKFASAVGEIMAQRAVAGDVMPEFPMFRLSRFR